jgi:hypothetical protein
MQPDIVWLAKTSYNVDMNKYYIITGLFLSVLLFGFTTPVAAQDDAWSLGGGYWTLPNYEGTGDTSGFYASAIMRSPTYMLELDYGVSDPGFMALAADYLYPLTDGTGGFGGAGFIGVGYTYFSADDLNNVDGFNILAAADLGDSLFGTVRYDFLGSDQELITFGVSYSFY